MWNRLLLVAVVVAASGMIAAAASLDRYDDAYRWIAHTSDVRLVVGRLIGHATNSSACGELRTDLDELAQLTSDNPTQQVRIPSLRAAADEVCRGAFVAMIQQLAAVDATERELLVVRRARLQQVRTWALDTLVISILGTVSLIGFSWMSSRRLQDSEQRFRMLAAHASDLIRIHDASGAPLYVSPSVERLLGFTPDEFMAKTPILDLGHPDDREKMLASLADIQRLHAPPTALVYRLRNKAGDYRWFETHTDPVHDRAGNLIRFYTTARDITARVEAEHALEQVAVTDELTGLHNRRGFTLIAGQALRLAIRQKRGAAIVFADLDELKPINDRLGHEAGDRAICDLAGVLKSTFRDSDVVARLGGDEFAVFMYDVDRPRVDSALERLTAAVEARNADSDRSYRVAVSIGVAVLAAGTTGSLDELLAEADRQMYVAKRARGVMRSTQPIAASDRS